MIGEVRVRAQEEEMQLNISPTVTTNVTGNFASSSHIPIAAGMEGVTKKPCTRFMTEQGCPFGREC
eukprot:8639550-Prorocentrum_lima.AAC.1